MKKLYTILLALSLCSPVSLAQGGKVEKGDEEFEDYSFIDAREAYLKVAAQGGGTPGVLKRLGDSYYFTADYANAANWYGVLYGQSPDMGPDYLYRYGLSLKSTGQYAASDEVMERFHAAKGNDYRAQLFYKERNYLEEIESQSGRFEVREAGFNSELSDFAPVFYQGGVVFASNRRYRGASKRLHDWNGQPFLDLYYLKGGGSGSAGRFSSDINTKYHESTAAFTKDGGTVYFTRNNYNRGDYKEDSGGTNRLKLYKGTLDGGSWEVEELPFNSDEYSVAHPSLSDDGGTLYFASDMPGGRGLSDLYSVSVDGGGYGAPKNLGEGINTEGRETFPFVGRGGELYFASDGHVGLGGLDIFVSEPGGGGFGEAFNVGKPVNSPQDDFTFVVAPGGTGYFASNRQGGKGDDDIYSFSTVAPLVTKCTQVVSGTVRDEVGNGPIPGAAVYLMSDSNDILSEAVSGADGSFEFELECARGYCIRSVAGGYRTSEKCFATGSKVGNELTRTLFLPPGSDLSDRAPAGVGSDLVKVLDLSPIYFDLGEDRIRPDAELELQKIIAALKLYPGMKVDVRSHTDSRADDAHNMDLSERRARRTVGYLVARGIDASRLSGSGYGEGRLVNGCSNGAGCSEAEHQLNRRSEFIIVE